MAVGAGLPTVGRWLGAAVGAVSGAAQRLILGVAGLEIKICRLPAPYGWVLPVAIAAMMLCSRRIRFGRGRRRALAATLCILLIGYLPALRPMRAMFSLTWGQGDAAVLRHGRQATLVDVGPAGCYDVLRYLRREGLYVDALILSHLDEDHAGRSARCWLPKSRSGGSSCRRAHRNPTHLRRCGRRSSWQTKGAFQSKRRPPERKSFRAALRLTCSPQDGMEGDNERSLVLYTQSVGARILTTGDLPAKSEMESPPDCDILKVAHHGSKYATSDEFCGKRRRKSRSSASAQTTDTATRRRACSRRWMRSALRFTERMKAAASPCGFRKGGSRRKLIAARHHQTRFPPHILPDRGQARGEGL